MCAAHSDVVWQLHNNGSSTAQAHLFEDDMLTQKSSVTLPDSQLWVILQRPNNIHHILLGQQHLQQFCIKCTDEKVH